MPNEPWTGGPKVASKLTKERVEKVLETAPVLLKRYLAQHGNWREVTAHRDQTMDPTSSHSWEFTPCECATCQETVRLVGHPETPNE